MIESLRIRRTRTHAGDRMITMSRSDTYCVAACEDGVWYNNGTNEVFEFNLTDCPTMHEVQRIRLRMRVTDFDPIFQTGPTVIPTHVVEKCIVSHWEIWKDGQLHKSPKFTHSLGLLYTNECMEMEWVLDSEELKRLLENRGDSRLHLRMYMCRQCQRTALPNLWMTGMALLMDYERREPLYIVGR